MDRAIMQGSDLLHSVYSHFFKPGKETCKTEYSFFLQEKIKFWNKYLYTDHGFYWILNVTKINLTILWRLTSSCVCKVGGKGMLQQPEVFPSLMKCIQEKGIKLASAPTPILNSFIGVPTKPTEIKIKRRNDVFLQTNIRHLS